MARLTRRPRAGVAPTTSGRFRFHGAASVPGGASARAIRDARRARWVVAFIGAVLPVLVGLLGAAPASAASSTYTYHEAAYAYGAQVHLSTPHTQSAAARASPTGPSAAPGVSHASLGRFGVATNTGDNLLTVKLGTAGY